jgi:DNA-binding NarL/FixJ family response regulator
VSPQFRVLVVDDHEFIRRGVCSLLADDAHLTVCGEAADGREAIAQVSKLNPHVAILDISMPLMNGLEAAAEIRRLAPAIKIVMLTMHDTPQMREQAQKAGADAYVVKTEAADKLIGMVRFLLQLDSAQHGG